MNIGEKIKKLRTAKLMTQSELAGSEITRNMLSQIENEAASPSLKTIRYIAQRLNVSPGYLIANTEDEKIYDKYHEISDIKTAYMSDDFRLCRDMCLHANCESDDEIKLILSECSLEIAIEEFNSGNLRDACIYFDEAIENCSATIYHTGYIVSIAGMYFKHMQLLSSTLESSTLDIDRVNIFPSLSNDFCLYTFLLENDGTAISHDMPRPTPDSPYAMHLLAREQLKEKNFSEAYKLLHEILYGLAKVPQPILYHVICDLEICCKELDDYKSAYEYSVEKLNTLQKLLS